MTLIHIKMVYMKPLCLAGARSLTPNIYEASVWSSFSRVSLSRSGRQSCGATLPLIVRQSYIITPPISKPWIRPRVRYIEDVYLCTDVLFKSLLCQPETHVSLQIIFPVCSTCGLRINCRISNINITPREYVCMLRCYAGAKHSGVHLRTHGRIVSILVFRNCSRSYPCYE